MQGEQLTGEITSPSRVAQGHPWRGYLFIATATLCWGAAATFGKAIFNGSLFAGHSLISPLVLTQARTTFTVILLSLFLLVRGGREEFRINRRDLVFCLLIGTLGIAGSNFFYYTAVQKTTVAIAITIQYTAPVWVLLYMVMRGRQRATPQRILGVALALVGTALTIGLFTNSGTMRDKWGIAAAMVAAFSFSFYNIGAQQLVQRHQPLKVMNYALLGSALLWLIVDPPWRLWAQHYTGQQWAFLFLFACFSMLLPYIFSFNGLKYLDPTRAVVTSCLEPVFAILFAGIFIHEAVRGLQVLGIAAVLAATIMVQKGSN